ncbi:MULTISPECIES: DUF2256 domain-containing protein [Crateriforma]|uniref:DUF2256 domain-containing protein n=1 Tax=Crateriforma TaxID=2714592 RepID=UPI0011B3A795|nr:MULTISPECIES: DUF2256 domain-containing protein [Crateriforma]
MPKNRDRKRTLPQKVCPVCGRTFAWRKKWRSHWEQVLYCSQRCRRQRDASSADRTPSPK